VLNFFIFKPGDIIYFFFNSSWFLGNELDFIGINGNTSFKTLLLREGESLKDLLNSDKEKFEIFDPNFTINKKYKNLIEEEINSKRKSIFNEVEDQDLVHDFLLYLISNDHHFFLNELIKRKYISNGEEKYFILRLEVIKSHLEEIYEKKMKIFEEEFHELEAENIADLHKFLFRIIQIFHSLIC